MEPVAEAAQNVPTQTGCARVLSYIEKCLRIAVCLPKDLTFLQRNETTCCNHPGALSPTAPCTLCFEIPLGTVVGYVAVVVGWNDFLNGAKKSNHQLEKVGINIGKSPLISKHPS